MELRSIATFKQIPKTEALLEGLSFKPITKGLVSCGVKLYEKTVYAVGNETVAISHEKGELSPRLLDPIVTINTSADVCKKIIDTMRSE